MLVDFSVKFILRRIFLLKECTFFFKLELLLAILPHSGDEFVRLFSFTKKNWSFEVVFDWLFWKHVVLRGGKFKLSTALRQQKHRILGQISKVQSLLIWPYMVFIQSDMKKLVVNIINFQIIKERGVTELLYFLRIPSYRIV